MTQRPHGLQSLKHSLSGPYKKRFAYSCPMLIFQYSQIWTRAVLPPLPPALPPSDAQRCKVLSLFYEIARALNIVRIHFVELNWLRRQVGWACDLEVRGLGFAVEGSLAPEDVESWYSRNSSTLQSRPAQSCHIYDVDKTPKNTFRGKRNWSYFPSKKNMMRKSH